MSELGRRARRLRVRANADTPRTPPGPASSAPRASACAAPSICSSATTGCRSCSEMILADGAEQRRARSTGCCPCSSEDFEGIFGRWTGCRSRSGCSTRRCTSSCPTARTCCWRSSGCARRRRADRRSRPASADRVAWLLHEQNPMLGTRGCRLGLLHPEIYEMQVRAIVRGALARSQSAAGGRRSCIPLVGFAEELRRLRELTERRRSRRTRRRRGSGSIDRHDDRGAACRADRRRDRRARPTSSRSAPTT